MLEGDKVQLIKRLNMVLVEVDKLNQEKGELLTQLHQERLRNEELEKNKRLSGPSKGERQLQKELLLEKDEVTRLRSIVNHLELEKAELRKRLGDLESEATHVYRENEKMVGQLHNVDHQANALNQDNRSLQDRMRGMSSQLGEYETEHANLLKERAIMRENLVQMESEKNEMINRFEDQTIKLDNFQVAVVNEKENLVWLHNRHTRLVSSRSIFLHLENFIHKRLVAGVGKMKHFQNFRVGKSKSTYRLWRVMNRYCNNKTSTAFKAWAQRLDWRTTANSRDQMANMYNKFTTKSRFFSEWRTIFTNVTRIRNRRELALRTIYKIFNYSNEGSLRSRFSIWSNKTTFFNTREVTLGGLIVAKYNQTLRRAVALYKRGVERLKVEQCQEDLCTELASLHFKHAVFSSLKNITFREHVRKVTTNLNEENEEQVYQLTVNHEMQQQVAHKQLQKSQTSRMVRMLTTKDLLRAWNTWKDENREWNQLQAWANKFKADSKANTWNWVERTFNAWKQYKTKVNFLTTKGELEIERPRRQELEMGLSREEKAHVRSQQKAACRAVTNMQGSKLRSYFLKWHEVMFYFSQNRVRVKNLISNHYKGKLKIATMKWRHNVYNDNIEKLCDANSTKQNENEGLVEHIGTLEADLCMERDHRARVKSRKVMRGMNRFHRWMKKVTLHKWAKNALSQANKIAAAIRICAEIKQRVMYNSVNKLIANMWDSKRKQGQRFRLVKFVMAGNKNMLMYLYEEWKHFVKCRKVFRNRIDAYQRAYKSFVYNRAWNKWIIKGVDASKIKELQDNIITLEVQNDGLNTNLVRHSRDLARMVKDKKQADKKLSARVRMRIANCFQRLMTENQERTFRIWRKNTLLCGRQSRYMSRMQLLWNIQISRKAIRTWMQNTFKTVHAEAQEAISGHIHDKKEMRREQQAQKESFEREIEMRDEEITNNYTKIGIQNKRLAHMLQKSVNTNLSDYSITRAQYCLRGWINRHRATKTAMKRLSQVGLHSVFKFSWSAIKEASRNDFKYNSIRAILMSAFKRYARRGLKNLFYEWKRTAVKRTNNLYEGEILTTSNNLQSSMDHNRTVQRRCQLKAFNTCQRWQKGKIFNAWIAVNKQIKRIQYARAAAENTLGTMRLRSGLGALLKEKAHRQQKNHKHSIAEVTYCRSIMRSAMNSWHFIKERNKYMQGILGMQDNRYVLVSLTTAFNYIKTMANVNTVNSNRIAEFRTSNFAKSFARLPVLMKRKFFTIWKDQGTLKVISLHRKRDMILHALHGKLRAAYALWKENCLVGDYLRDAETAGPIAQQCNALKNRVQIYESLIKKEGIDPKYVEHYVLEHETLKEAQQRKAVSRLQYNAKQTTTKVDTSQVLPRAFLSWKQFLLKKKRVKRSAIRMWSRMRRPGVYKAFRTWRNGLALVSNTLAPLTRQEIMGVVAKMDRDSKTLEGMVENAHGQIKYLQSYS